MDVPGDAVAIAHLKAALHLVEQAVNSYSGYSAAAARAVAGGNEMDVPKMPPNALNDDGALTEHMRAAIRLVQTALDKYPLEVAAEMAELLNDERASLALVTTLLPAPTVSVHLLGTDGRRFEIARVGFQCNG